MNRLIAILFLLASVIGIRSANIDLRALNTNQFTTNIPSAGYVGIKGYGVTNVPGTNINISAGGSITFTTNGPNITIGVTGLGQATNVFLIAGTNINIITNGSGTWTISAKDNFWVTNIADGAIQNLNGSAGVIHIGSVNQSDYWKSPNSLLSFGDVGNTGNGSTFIVDDVAGHVVANVPYIGDGTYLTNLNGTNIDIAYNGGLVANSNGVHRVTVSINTNVIQSIATNVVSQNAVTGSVSVAMTGDSIIFSNTVPGSPVVNTGTLVPGLLKQGDNKVLSGPITGANATPTFRSLAAEDLPVVAGSNVTLTTNANVLTIASTGGGGGTVTTNFATTNSNSGLTNAISSIISNQTPNFINGTTNQFAKFSPNTNTVGDSILSETTSNFVDLKAGGGAGTTPNGSSAAGYRVYGTFTNATGFKRLDLDWSVSDQAFRVLADVGSGVPNGQAPVLEIGASNVTWAVNTLGTLYPMSDNNYNLGGVSGRIKNVWVGTGGIQGAIGSLANPNYTVVGGAGGWYDTGDTIGFTGASSGEKFRMVKAGGVGGSYFHIGANPLVGSPSGVTVQDSYWLSVGPGIWQAGTNRTTTSNTNIIQGSGATGNNTPGGDLIIAGGPSTGSNASGKIFLATGGSGAATSTQNTLTNRMEVDPVDGKVIIYSNLVVNGSTTFGALTASSLNVASLTVTNPDNTIWIMSSNGIGTNTTLYSGTNYGSVGKTNLSWMDPNGWHNTNSGAANWGTDIGKGGITNLGMHQTATMRITNPTNATTIVNLGLDANGNVSTNASAIGGSGSQVYSNQTLNVAGTANQITSSAGAQDLTVNRTVTLSLPDPLVPPGALTPAGVITGNGSGVTNVWIRQTISGGYANQAGSSANKFLPLNGMMNTAGGSANLFSSLLPSGGYLSNLVVYVSAVFPTTTNIVFNVQTNTPPSNPVDSLLTCTLLGGYAYTNDSVHSVILTTNVTYSQMRFICSAVLPTQGLGWSVEWWHQ